MRSLTAHEKLDAIRRVHEGESKASVARDIGVPESTLRGWCKNEDKISYLSRQSSPDSNEDVEPKEKRQKMEEPYNLSLKANYPDLTKSEMEAAKTIADLSMKVDPQKVSNRAELAKLSVELGLNRQEFYTPTTTASGNSNNVDITSNFLAQWNNILLQQQLLQNKTAPSKVTAAPADTTIVTSTEPQKPILPKPDKTVEDQIWYWLKTQQAMLMANQPHTTTTTTPTIDQTSCSWFWRWYKSQISNGQILPDKPILYQQLTKSRDVENIEQPPTSKSQTTKARAVLDNLLFYNNVPPSSRRNEFTEVETALEHGEKFLRWLETCSEPSVTTVQIMQFKTLLNNVRTDVGRKNGEVQNKAKVKRK